MNHHSTEVGTPESLGDRLLHIAHTWHIPQEEEAPSSLIKFVARHMALGACVPSRDHTAVSAKKRYSIAIEKGTPKDMSSFTSTYNTYLV